jgi:biopolymer transport protein ExbD
MFSWDDNPDLNITPLVDVMLVLMAILMVTAPTITYQEKINLPEGSKTVQSLNSKSLTIRMDEKQNIFIGKEKFTLKTFADDFINMSTVYDKDMDVYIRADQNLAYKDVMYILKTMKEAGFTKVSLVTQ